MFVREDTDDKTFFSRYDKAHPLSSHVERPFELDGMTWLTIEHYFQAMKFSDEELRQRINQAASAEQAAKIGSKWYRRPRADWKKIQTVVMTRAVYVSAKTYPEVAQALLESLGQTLIENDAYDYFWGCGRDKRGENQYGQVLMKVREKLIEEQPSS
ncbi:swarming motility protein [Neiella marina]|uniref:Swarming motility protein n=1 Tax=Neiella marina TaxID=508461 RepID=A0A8J2U2B9_9GAMM|nr:NADAR family protein [Neiella marina]GGA65707.1 swarming motility protein [Neiella marina]